MKTTFAKVTTLCLINGALILAGCTSSDDSPPPNPIPSNARTIDATNAEDTVSAAVGTGTALMDYAFGAEAVAMPTAMDFVNIIKDKMDNKTGAATLNLPVGASGDPISCSISGTYTDTYTETATSISGTLTFDACTEFNTVLNDTFTISGTANYSGSFTATADYNASFSGNATFSASGIDITIKGLSANISGNDISGDFNVSKFNYTLDTSLGGGFGVALESALQGNDFLYGGCPTSGAAIASGASSTRARGQFNSDDTVTVSYDDGSGTFTVVSTTSCSNYI